MGGTPSKDVRLDAAKYMKVPATAMGAITD
ncbi:hypothetical protein OKW43_001078 [Paraburkholderia sp. WC7.3g]